MPSAFPLKLDQSVSQNREFIFQHAISQTDNLVGKDLADALAKNERIEIR